MSDSKINWISNEEINRRRSRLDGLVGSRIAVGDGMFKFTGTVKRTCEHSVILSDAECGSPTGPVRVPRKECFVSLCTAGTVTVLDEP